MARPEFKPTHEQRRTVMRTKAAGMAHKDIAAVLGIDEETLAKHFERELLHGPAIVRQELLAIVMESAMAGKKSAIALLERMTRDDRLFERRRRRVVRRLTDRADRAEA